MMMDRYRIVTRHSVQQTSADPLEPLTVGNAEFDTASIFDWLDLAKFVGDDGEPDTKAITAAVERLVPATPQQPRGFEHGPRGQAAPMDMNQLIRRQAGRG